MRRNFDQLKSKNVLKSLALKKRLQESKTILSDSRIVWKSELLNLKNSSEIFQATQSRKQLIREKIFEELIKTVSSIDLSHLGLSDKENLSTQVLTEGIFDSSCICSESTLNQTMARTMDSIKEKVKNLCASSNANNLTAVDEKIEISIETNPNFNIERIGSSVMSDSLYTPNEYESSYNGISSDGSSVKSFETSNEGESFRSPERISERSYDSYTEGSKTYRHESFDSHKGNVSSSELSFNDKVNSKTSRHESFDSRKGNISSSEASYNKHFDDKGNSKISKHESFDSRKGNISSSEASCYEHLDDKANSKISRHESFDSRKGHACSSKPSDSESYCCNSGDLGSNSSISSRIHNKSSANSSIPSSLQDHSTEKLSPKLLSSSKSRKSYISNSKSPDPAPPLEQSPDRIIPNPPISSRSHKSFPNSSNLPKPSSYMINETEKKSSNPPISNRSQNSNISISKSPRPSSYKSYKSDKNSSKQQPEEEEIDDTMIGLIEHSELQITTIGVTTLPDHLATREKETAYVICESENGERTQEVRVTKKTWKMWICPCIFKVKY